MEIGDVIKAAILPQQRHMTSDEKPQNQKKQKHTHKELHALRRYPDVRRVIGHEELGRIASFSLFLYMCGLAHLINQRYTGRNKFNTTRPIFLNLLAVYTSIKSPQAKCRQWD